MNAASTIWPAFRVLGGCTACAVHTTTTDRASCREAVTEALRIFRDQGWIATGRRRIIVLDDDALRRDVERRRRA